MDITHSDVFGHMRDVVFIDDNINIGCNLEMRPSRRNEASIVGGVDESSKSPLFDFGKYIEEREEQVGGNVVAM